MATGTRKLTVEILGDAHGLSGAFGNADAGVGKFAKGIVAAGAIIGAAVIGAGVALYKMGEDLDAAFDTIQIKTGATGDALEGLKDSFRAVAVETPASLKDVGDAVAGLAQRVDETHPSFNTLVEQVLDLTSITGGDLETNIDKVTRLMGDWSITMDDSGAALDRVFRASQMTGTSFDQLADLAVTFGSPMRALGFTFDETVALLATFQAEGVNTELVMGSMRKALGKLASEGKDAPAALRETMQAIKDAGDASSATALAIDLFGVKAGPDMAAAIREGRFEIDGLLASMQDGAPGITATAEATEDAGEKFKQLKNRITIALEPLASGVFDAVGDAMTAIGPVVSDLADKFMEHWPEIQATMQEVFVWLRDVAWPVYKAYAEFMIDVYSKVIDWFRTNWPAIQEAVAGVIAYFQEWMPKIEEAVSHVVTAIMVIWDMFGDEIMSVLVAVFEVIKAVVTEAFQIIKNLFEFFINIINGEWGAAWQNILNIFSSIWDAIIAILNGVIQIVWQLIQGLWDGLLAILAVVGEAFIGLWRTTFETIHNIATGIVNAIIGAFQWMWNSTAAIFAGIWNTITGTFSGLWGTISGYIETVRSGIVGVFDSVSSKISEVLGSIPDAFKSAWNTVANFINGISITIPGLSIAGQEIFGDIHWNMPDVVPRLAAGGIVQASPGGILANIGEGRHDEAVIPLTDDVLSKMGGQGNVYTMEVHTTSLDVEQQFRRMEMRNGARWRRAG